MVSPIVISRLRDMDTSGFVSLVSSFFTSVFSNPFLSLAFSFVVFFLSFRLCCRFLLGKK